MACKETRNCDKHGRVEFVLEGRGYYRCTLCRQERVAEQRRRNKRKLVELFGGACMLCGYDRCIAALEFHHLDKETKEFSLSNSGATKSFKELLTEADKCILVCANCHREVESGVAVIPSELVDQPKRKPYSRPALKRKESPVCLSCGIETSSLYNAHCRPCAMIISRDSKIKWPELDELTRMVESSSYSAVGKKLGVSDNAVRKHLRNHSALAERRAKYLPKATD